MKLIQKIIGTFGNAGYSLNYASGGAGYYSGVTCGTSWELHKIGYVGGQGGIWDSPTSFQRDWWLTSKAGDGGMAGEGGYIRVSEVSQVFAYNGGFSVLEPGVESYSWECSINEDEQTSSSLKGDSMKEIIRQDLKRIFPSFIFAQYGVIRETYATNVSEHEVSKVKINTGSSIKLIEHTAEAESVLASYAKKIEVSSYNNGVLPNQGIGSRCRLYRAFKWNIYSRFIIKLKHL